MPMLMSEQPAMAKVAFCCQRGRAAYTLECPQAKSPEARYRAGVSTWLLVLLTLSWPLIAAAATAHVVGMSGTAVARWNPAGASVVFLTLVWFISGIPRLVARTGRVRSLGRHATAVLALFAAIAVLIGAPLESVIALAAVGILIPAFVEEYVFRGIIPHALNALLLDCRVGRRSARIAAVVLAQAVFAACHFVSASTRAAGWTEGARLFVGGLLYSNVVAASGIGTAAAVHATMNLTLSNSVALGDLAPSPFGLLLTGVLALVGLLIRVMPLSPLGDSAFGGQPSPTRCS